MVLGSEKILKLTADEVRQYLRDHHPEDYALIDIGQPWEYEQKHLPGARLIPVGGLPDRLDELDAGKPTILYCRSGLRSRSAASLLSHCGFAQVIWMSGGIDAWQGIAASGLPEPGLAPFEGLRSPEEHVAMAWVMENGMRTFYTEAAPRVDDREVVIHFNRLAQVEEHHQATLLALYEGLTGRRATPDFPADVLAAMPEEKLIEGGVPLRRALELIEGRGRQEILELAIALETDAYDRYLLLRRELEDENSRRVFEVLSDEEKRHLRILAGLLDKLG
jgi:sulfur-carrier protein adenylyltransferase/sulfurtransferase